MIASPVHPIKSLIRQFVPATKPTALTLTRPFLPRRGQRDYLRRMRRDIARRLSLDVVGNRAQRREAAQRFKFGSF